ncbi:MAG: carboxymuconolactone decarboxylase family protein [Usitatibacter sp.]
MFLVEPDTPEAAAFLEKERAQNGYVMNLDRAWAWRPDLVEGFAAMRKQLIDGSTLNPREIALLVCASARALGDSYCSLAWGARFAKLADASLVAQVLRGADAPKLSTRERALRLWAEQVVTDPNSAQASDVDALRAAGLSEKEILEATVFIAFRLAFSTVNDALGARPDRELVAEAPAEVREAVTYGRRAAE